MLIHAIYFSLGESKLQLYFTEMYVNKAYVNKNSYNLGINPAAFCVGIILFAVYASCCLGMV